MKNEEKYKRHCVLAIEFFEHMHDMKDYHLRKKELRETIFALECGILTLRQARKDGEVHPKNNDG